jgi:hypothetical protein
LGGSTHDGGVVMEVQQPVGHVAALHCACEHSPVCALHVSVPAHEVHEPPLIPQALFEVPG